MKNAQYTNKPTLNVGQTVAAADGMQYTIRKFLGKGGQGDVYLVEGGDGQFALKWYHKENFLDRINSENFYKNIRKNVERGVPHLSTGATATQFIWPQKLVDWQLGSFGYLMPLFNPEYSSFSDVIMGRHQNNDGSETPLKWKSWFIRLTAALNLVRAFEILHAAGLSYQDLNDGGFAINMKNGDVMICDCDNVAPDKTNLGILGVLIYMAPEVARREKLPDRWTDQYSLAIVLFRLLFNNHPMEGVESISLHSSERLSRQDADMRIYGTHPHYCLDMRNRLNPPDTVRHSDVRRLCQLYPTVLMEAFDRVFTKGVDDPSMRLSATEWRKTLLQARDQLIQIDGREHFCRTPDRKNLPSACRVLCYADGRRVLCMPNKILYQCHFGQYNADYATPVAKIIETNRPNVIGLYSAMEQTIRVTWQGKESECSKGSRIPLLADMTLKVDDLTIRVE